MSSRKVRFQGLQPCPGCGNRQHFVSVSQQVAEDHCEVWLRCGSCGREPDSAERREDVWGSLDRETVACLAQDWNQWVESQDRPPLYVYQAADGSWEGADHPGGPWRKVSRSDLLRWSTAGVAPAPTTPLEET